jgi:hypothetical protein
MEEAEIRGAIQYAKRHGNNILYAIAELPLDGPIPANLYNRLAQELGVKETMAPQGLFTGEKLHEPAVTETQTAVPIPPRFNSKQVEAETRELLAEPKIAKVAVEFIRQQGIPLPPLPSSEEVKRHRDEYSALSLTKKEPPRTNAGTGARAGWPKPANAQVSANIARKKRALDTGVLVQIYTAQGRACAICRRPFAINELELDHPHKNEELVRGLVCSLDNRRIGVIENNRTIAKRIEEYLDKYDEQETK